jgi:23S rRNA (cytosine1962-C5)-methyltransferase
VSAKGPSAVVSRRGEDRVRAGHPWIYRSDVVEADAAPGDIVRVIGTHQRTLGEAFFSDQSQITLRMVTAGDESFGERGWHERIAAALRFRDSLTIDATAYRLVHGEADGLPSLIVDRYDDYLVLQALSQATERHLPEIVAALVDLLSPAGILARNDPRVRALEGLPQAVKVLHGEVPAVIEVREGLVSYQVDPWHGQKTGLFLDQRENREAAGRYAHGRVLDCFSYNGGFALYLAPQSESVLALDASADAVARISANAARNHLAHVSAREANVFDELRYFERERTRFDTIVLDPPAFAKSRATVPSALRGYREINLRAMRLLESGGALLTASCSFHVRRPEFLAMLAEAAADSGRRMTLESVLGQGVDHPELLTVPETGYLKGAVLRAD